MTDPKSYTGNCHCGKVKYSFSLSPPIEDQDVVQCNCSICHINGYLLVYPKVEDFRPEHGEDEVKAYRFGSEQVPHYFCGNCGTSVYARSTIPGLSHIVALNVRTVPGVEIESLKIKKMDGRSVNFKKQG
ncbi:Mss4-like protein [Aspergillus leporis]|uniref:Mss4-like protein n=1 Tax=Aspergillus leporis TaxID=41062 RepID=A0A5N5X0M8_9EURO|nr:Mss4-like protein [Aspergillus leporis]